MDADHGRGGDAGADRRVPHRRCGPRARRVEEMRGLAEQMLAHANRIEVPGAEPRHRRHRRRPRAHRQHLDDVGHRGRGGRGAGRQARQPGGVVVLGQRPTCSRRWASTCPCRPSASSRSPREAGITFCFAQTFHPSFRHTAVPRRELGIGTAFNFLGRSPTPPSRRMPRWAAPTPAWLRCWPASSPSRGRDAAVFRGDDGLDEITVSTTSSVWWVRDGQVSERSLDPTRLGLELHPIEALRGGDAAHNAQVVRDTVRRCGWRGARRRRCSTRASPSR